MPYINILTRQACLLPDNVKDFLHFHRLTPLSPAIISMCNAYRFSMVSNSISLLRIFYSKFLWTISRGSTFMASPCCSLKQTPAPSSNNWLNPWTHSVLSSPATGSLSASTCSPATSSARGYKLLSPFRRTPLHNDLRSASSFGHTQ